MISIIKKIINIDEIILIKLNNLGNELYDNIWINISHVKTCIPIYIFLILIIYYIYKIKKTIYVVFFSIIILLFTDQTSSIIKNKIKRYRPCINNKVSKKIRIIKNTCKSKYGFYSAHASNHFSLLFFLAKRLKKYFKNITKILLLYGFIIGYSRIYLGVHFPLDVLLGAITGTYIGYISNIIYEKYIFHI